MLDALLMVTQAGEHEDSNETIFDSDEARFLTYIPFPVGSVEDD